MKDFILNLPWRPVGVVDVNLPFKVATPQGYQLEPVLAYFNEFFFNSSHLPKINADLKLDFSQFNMTDLMAKIQAMLGELTGFEIDFEFPSVSSPSTSGSGTSSKFGSFLSDFQGRFDFLNPMKLFNSLRSDLFDGYDSMYMFD